MEEISLESGLTGPVEELLDEGPLDPMSPEYAPGLSLIIQMRIYDVLMCLLKNSDSELAEKLGKLHGEGGLLSPMPWIDPDTNNI